MPQELGSGFEAVWRRESPHVLGALMRRFHDFGRCEDALQEALLAATQCWPQDGLPKNPRGWLIRAAARRLIDARRSDQARITRESTVAALDPGFVHAVVEPDQDDSLQVLLLCCHASLSTPSRVALTLRAVGGLTTEQVAAAFLVPVPTMAQRISRAKASLSKAGVRLRDVSAKDLPERVRSVRQVLYLIFNEGYTRSGGTQLRDVSLTREAIRLARELHLRLPSDTETAGLLALMLLTEARAAARVEEHGELIPLAEQNRARWNTAMIEEGVAIVERALPEGQVGPLQLQAAIAAVHDEAVDYADTDWAQIAELYRMLGAIAPGPIVTMNSAVAVAMTDGPAVGLETLDPLMREPKLARHHRLHAVRAHLLELAGRFDESRAAYRDAARLTTSMPEQRYLSRRAGALDDQARDPH